MESTLSATQRRACVLHAATLRRTCAFTEVVHGAQVHLATLVGRDYLLFDPHAKEGTAASPAAACPTSLPINADPISVPYCPAGLDSYVILLTKLI